MTDIRPRFETDATVLVTGAGGGIGRAVVARFAQEGLRIAGTDRDRDSLAETAELAREVGAEFLDVVGDITDKSFRPALVKQVVDKYGQLDVLVNNAGMMSSGDPAQITEEAWDEIYGLNVKAPFFLTQSALPYLKERQGAVVNLSSVLGLIGVQGGSAYSSSKAAIVGMTWALSIDLAPEGVRVNAVCPGTIDTRMPWAYIEGALPPERHAEAADIFVARQLMKRMGKPSEVASLIMFLASSEASFMTGTIVPVDGGWSAW